MIVYVKPLCNGYTSSSTGAIGTEKYESIGQMEAVGPAACFSSELILYLKNAKVVR